MFHKYKLTLFSQFKNITNSFYLHRTLANDVKCLQNSDLKQKFPLFLSQPHTDFKKFWVKLSLESVYLPKALFHVSSLHPVNLNKVRLLFSKFSPSNQKRHDGRQSSNSDNKGIDTIIYILKIFKSKDTNICTLKTSNITVSYLFSLLLSNNSQQHSQNNNLIIIIIIIIINIIIIVFILIITFIIPPEDNNNNEKNNSYIVTFIAWTLITLYVVLTSNSQNDVSICIQMLIS